MQSPSNSWVLHPKSLPLVWCPFLWNVCTDAQKSVFCISSGSHHLKRGVFCCFRTQVKPSLSWWRAASASSVAMVRKCFRRGDRFTISPIHALIGCIFVSHLIGCWSVGMWRHFAKIKWCTCSCTGLQHEGIFRVSGSQVEVNDIKNAFERGIASRLQETLFQTQSGSSPHASPSLLDAGEDPLAEEQNEHDLDSIAGVLKLYFRGLDHALFPKEVFHDLISCVCKDLRSFWWFCTLVLFSNVGCFWYFQQWRASRREQSILKKFCNRCQVKPSSSWDTCSPSSISE